MQKVILIGYLKELANSQNALNGQDSSLKSVAEQQKQP